MGGKPREEAEEQKTELEQRPQSRREWGGAWRSVIVPLVALVAIVGAIWYLQSNSLPGLGDDKAQAGSDPGDKYYSLKSQGIKLGAAGGPGPKAG